MTTGNDIDADGKRWSCALELAHACTCVSAVHAGDNTAPFGLIDYRTRRKRCACRRYNWHSVTVCAITKAAVKTMIQCCILGPQRQRRTASEQRAPSEHLSAALDASLSSKFTNLNTSKLKTLSLASCRISSPLLTKLPPQSFLQVRLPVHARLDGTSIAGYPGCERCCAGIARATQALAFHLC